MTALAKKKIVTFLVITLGISMLFYVPIIRAGTLDIAGGLLVLGLMWAPGIAGMATQLIYEHTLRGMGWRFGPFKYLLIAFLLPLLYCLIVYGITWTSQLGGFPNPEMMSAIQERWGGMMTSPVLQIMITVVLTILLGLPAGLLSGMGEEIGWRGVLVPELAKVMSFGKVALVSGVIWILWHFPLLFFADYNMAGAPKWYAGLMFAVMVLGISFAFAWLRLKSKSIWPAAILHASHNLFVQVIFTPLTIKTAITPYIIDEFGIGLALMGVLVALVFWQKGKKLGA